LSRDKVPAPQQVTSGILRDQPLIPEPYERWHRENHYKEKG
jgi:hypothetical protein